MARRVTYVVYWLHDAACTDPKQHGYVGVTCRLTRRLSQHRTGQNARVPKDFGVEILMRGTKTQCMELEHQLRPQFGIGWNFGIGGFADGTSLKDAPKPPEQREKMRQAALARYADPKERERTSKAVKVGLKGIDRTGTNNANFGKHMSEQAKQKVRDKIAERGGLFGKSNPNYRHGEYCED